MTSTPIDPPSQFALDYASRDYSYIERPNSTLLKLLSRHVLEPQPMARILDVGCGAGANARAVRELSPGVRLVGIEPNARAAELARQACDEVFEGTVQQWLETEPSEVFDGIILSDVIEHLVEPVEFLRRLRRQRAVRGATWIISVPNYAVWYNRLFTLLGRFEYSWSGLYDRTHLRFFTRRSILELLEYCGFDVLEDRCSPSVVQSTAPILRKFFDRDVNAGNHLSLTESSFYRLYRSWVEPVETAGCQLWPELLAFQIVSAARLRAG
jgi:SAM-dependent methyltransferase